MNTSTVISFTIPAVAIFMLIALIIKEQGYSIGKNYFQKKNETEKSKQLSNGRKNKDYDSENDQTNYIDFSGGILGI